MSRAQATWILVRGKEDTDRIVELLREAGITRRTHRYVRICGLQQVDGVLDATAVTKIDLLTEVRPGGAIQIGSQLTTPNALIIPNLPSFDMLVFINARDDNTVQLYNVSKDMRQKHGLPDD